MPDYNLTVSFVNYIYIAEIEIELNINGNVCDHVIVIESAFDRFGIDWVELLNEDEIFAIKEQIIETVLGL